MQHRLWSRPSSGGSDDGLVWFCRLARPHHKFAVLKALQPQQMDDGHKPTNGYSHLNIRYFVSVVQLRHFIKSCKLTPMAPRLTFIVIRLDKVFTPLFAASGTFHIWF